MPKVKMPRAGGLPEQPPAKLSKTERTAYDRLRSQLIDAGFASIASVETVLVTARQMARCERLSAEIDLLDSWTISSPTGAVQVHPLVRELRSVESQVKQGLTQLLLTPRSQSTARVKQEDQPANSDDDTLESLLS